MANRLISTSDGVTTTTYSYDGDGKRLSVTSGGQTTSELWDPNAPLPQLALEQDGSGGLLRRYLYGADLISMTTPAGSFYDHYDGLGSVRNVTSSGGATEWTDSYEPFGAIQSETQNDPNAPANPIKFAGQFFDSDAGLYHLRARQYDPVGGRFLGLDQLASTSTNPYTASYVYGLDRPTVLVDPSGLGPCLSCALHKIENAADATAGFVTHVATAAPSVLSHAAEAATGFVQHSNLDIATGAAAAFCVATGVETLGAGCTALAAVATLEAVGRSGYQTGVTGPGRARWSAFAAQSSLALALYGVSQGIEPAADSLLEREILLTESQAEVVGRFGESAVFTAGWIGANIK